MNHQAMRNLMAERNFRWRRDLGRDVPIAGNTFYTGKYLFVAAV